MRIPIVKCGWPWIIVPLIVGGLLGLIFWAVSLVSVAWVIFIIAVVLSLFMVYFHRDPERVANVEEGDILAGADGLIRQIEDMPCEEYLHKDVVLISTFLSPFDVHVNRAPMAGEIRRLEYTPGRHMITYHNAATLVNEHSSILIGNDKLECLVCQIVGPIVRRVVYWLKLKQMVNKGEVIGMMRFGSRLDVYLPKDSVTVMVKKGDRVKAGLTVIAKLKNGR